MLVRSVQYPNLRVHVGDVSVKFRDGLAEVSDAVGATLIELAGIEVADAEPEAEQVGSEGADDADSPVSADAEPVKRKPGRPKKSD